MYPQTQLNPLNALNNSFYSSSNIIPSSINNLLYNNIKLKKRNYNEFLKAYKQSNINSYLSEAEGLNRSLNLNYKKNIESIKDAYQDIHSIDDKKVLVNDLSLNAHKKRINLDQKKKFMYDEDFIDLNEKDFMSEKKYGLSKSYLYDEEPGFYSDLDDTKENSFFSLNFSFDYPEINLDKNINNKLISNALELEKTFNRIFNVKNIPNKNNGIELYSKMQEYRDKFIWGKFIEKMKKDYKDKINKDIIREMIIDSSDEDNNGEMPKYNPLYNDNFFDDNDNDMILDD